MPAPNQPLPIGIDLGTTYSAVAVIDAAGRPQTLINAEGDKLTPSAVLFEGPNVVVGKEALKALSTDAPDVAQFSKRELGHRVFSKMLCGRQYPPEAIEGFILNKLRLDARRVIGDFEQVVITVPAYFDEVRRKATQDAGYIAGFEVMDILNEPTAAAIAFGYEQGFLSADGKSQKRQRILVYDLGGGTFDVTVMEIGGSEFIALATDGDAQLGGYDWDQRLVDRVAEEFIRKHSLDPREDLATVGRLWRDCEDAKRTLSARTKAMLTCDYRGKSLKTEVNREQFEDLTKDLLDRTAFTTRQTLQAAGLEWSDIDRVLLVGGSTRMPAVYALLEKMSGKPPDCSISADEAVAHGAALHAGLLLSRSRGEPPKFKVRNVNSHSLGVLGTDPKINRQRNAILIPRNSPLPATARRSFKTQKPDQRTILVQIVEGESANPEDCAQIGRCTASSLPRNLPAQSEIEVRFTYEENGRLKVAVRVAGSANPLEHEIQRENSLTQEQLDAWRKFVSGLAPKSVSPPNAGAGPVSAPAD